MVGNCTICQKETNDKVNDNIGGQSHLCSECRKLFEQCPVCMEFSFKEELNEQGLCENCSDELTQEVK